MSTTPQPRSPEPEITADEDGVRIFWPSTDHLAYPIGDVATVIGKWASEYPTYRLDYALFEPTGLLLDFCNPASVL